MEYARKPSSKASANVYEIVSIFAKVCRLKSIGVISSEKPNPEITSTNNSCSLVGKSSGGAEEKECEYVEKIHPQPSEIISKGNEYEHEILKLFNTILALKLAYIRLQEAHVPYDAEKIKAADECVVSELEALCKMKRAYKEKKLSKHRGNPSLLTHLSKEIQAHKKLLVELDSQIKARDSEVLLLQNELMDLELKNKDLVEEVKRQSCSATGDVNVILFQDAYKAVSKSIHNFAKPMISLMKASGWDLDLAANSIEVGVFYSKRSHKKYAFEVYIARRMFCDFSLKSRNDDDIMRFDDPFEALIENPDSDFAKFCRSKYLLIVHPKMEGSFFGNLDQRIFISSGKHPRTPFYQAFVNMVKWFWVLQGIASTITPKAEVFWVQRGSKFSEVYMECVEEDTKSVGGGRSNLFVEFMVMPGFKIGKTLVRSRVYLSTMVNSSIHT